MTNIRTFLVLLAAVGLSISNVMAQLNRNDAQSFTANTSIIQHIYGVNPERKEPRVSFEQSEFETPNLQQSTKTKSVDDWWEPDTVYIFNVDSALVLRFSYSYDGYNNMLTRLVGYRQSDEWVNRVKDTYSYDGYNNMLTRLVGYLQNDDWVNNVKYTYSYDENNNLLTELSENLQNGYLVNYEKYTYSYDENNNMLTELYESWQNGDWVRIKEYIYCYDENNNIILTKLYESWQNDWVNTAKITDNYDENNNMLTRLIENLQNGGWVNYRKYAFSYDENNNLLTELWEYWQNDDWVIRVKCTYTYDENNNMLTVLSENRQDGKWINSFQILWTYDENSNCVLREYLSWIDGRWQPNQSGRAFYYNNMQSYQIYFGYKVIATYIKLDYSGIADIPQNNTLGVYPNPTKGQLTIESGELEIESIEVYDVLGRNCFSPTSSRSCKTTINISHLSKGTYFVKIKTATGESVRKVIKE